MFLTEPCLCKYIHFLIQQLDLKTLFLWKADAYLYTLICTYLFLIGIFVFLMLVFVLFNPYLIVFNQHNTIIEFLWTCLPLCVLLTIALPSINYLFFSDPRYNEGLTIKVIGNQWYWSYYYIDFNLQVDSYITTNTDLILGNIKLLITDQPCVLPININIKFLISSSDVLHRWTIPSLLLKSDAIPGVSVMLRTFLTFPGTYLGICSELCGAYHAFIPIHIEVTSLNNFKEWLVLV